MVLIRVFEGCDSVNVAADLSLYLSQVLQGLETYIESEKFLHTLEAVSAEWIDLSDHQQQPHKGGSPHVGSLEIDLQQVGWHCVQLIPMPCLGCTVLL